MNMRRKLAALVATTGLLVGTLAMAGAVLASTGPSDQQITPTLHDGNIQVGTGTPPPNNDYAACSPKDAVETGSGSGSGASDNGVSVAWTYNGTTKALSFVATGGLVNIAYVKGGNAYNEYDYSGKSNGGVASDGHLYAPDNASGGPAGLSHAIFCTTPEEDGGPESALITTDVHLGDGVDEGEPVIVDNADPAFGTPTVHDSATLSFTGGIQLPADSTVTFSFYDNGNCSGDAKDTKDVDVSGATSAFEIDPGLVEGPLAAGAYSFKADFTSGDTETVGNASGDCEPFVVLTQTTSGETTSETTSGTTTLPPTAEFGDTSNPTDHSWILIAALGMILGSLLVLTPARARNKR